MNDWPFCPHYVVGAADKDGFGVCAECGAAVQLRIAGLPVDEFLRGVTTRVAREGEDAWPYRPPGE